MTHISKQNDIPTYLVSHIWTYSQSLESLYRFHRVDRSDVKSILRTAFIQIKAPVSESLQIRHHYLYPQSARLVQFGICEAQLSQCGLLLLREAPETPRPTHRDDDANGNNDISLSYFIPALSAWLRQGGYKLFGLCARGHASALSTDDAESPEDQWVTAGPLLSISTPEHEERLSGFSMTRCEFWKQRFDEVAGDHCALEDTVQGQARHCFNFLDTWERITGGEGHDRETARQVFFDLE